MKLRYDEGNGTPPIYVSSIRRDHGGGGAFVMASNEGDRQEISFFSHAEFLQIFQSLLAESVALSAGGHSAGPADEAALLLSSGELEGLYVEISWSAPAHWRVREMSLTYVPPWERVPEPSMIANTSFPALLRPLAAPSANREL